MKTQVERQKEDEVPESEKANASGTNGEATNRDARRMKENESTVKMKNRPNEKPEPTVKIKKAGRRWTMHETGIPVDETNADDDESKRKLQAHRRRLQKAKCTTTSTNAVDECTQETETEKPTDEMEKPSMQLGARDETVEETK